jgi:hypothetical protein
MNNYVVDVFEDTLNNIVKQFVDIPLSNDYPEGTEAKSIKFDSLMSAQ